MCVHLIFFFPQIKRLTDTQHEYAEVVSDDEQIIEWSKDQLRKRSQELQLIDENGQCILPSIDSNSRSHTQRNRPQTTDDGVAVVVVEIDDGSKSASTTSDSQITVRSSPIAAKIDRLSVCRHCHKNCRQRLNQPRNTSLKVQHSQSSSSRCCQSTSTSTSLAESPRSSSSRTSSNSKCTKHLPTIDNENNDIALAFSPMLSTRSSSSAKTLTSCSNNNNNSASCKCRCTEDDFANIERQTQEVKRETCKLLNDVSELQAAKNKSLDYWPHAACDCTNTTIPIRESKISNMNEDASRLVGLSEFHPISNYSASDSSAVPKISVVPPTPDTAAAAAAKLICENSIPPWTHGTSPDDSPQDEELPYRSLSTSLKRYGTMSSLEKLPSAETDDKTYDSSETDDFDKDSNNGKMVECRIGHWR